MMYTLHLLEGKEVVPYRIAEHSANTLFKSVGMKILTDLLFVYVYDGEEEQQMLINRHLIVRINVSG